MKKTKEPTSTNAESIRQSEIGNRKCELAWNGWTFALPDEWSPVKIEGDWNKGSILIADFHSTRLAIRWQAVPRKKFNAQKWAQQAIASEVGQLMLKQSVEHVPSHSPSRRDTGTQGAFSVGRLFVEPEPPGRDVWVGHSSVSNRLLEVVYQTKTVSNALREQILPTISDQPPDAEQCWSIFDLSCRVGVGWTLQSKRLNAGDLTLSFAKKNDTLIVRQLAPATLALSRQPLERWLDAQQQIWKKTYRLKGEIAPLASLEDSQCLTRAISRRRRFFYARWISRQRVTIASHNVERDRVVLIDASSSDIALQTLSSVGKEYC